MSLLTLGVVGSSAKENERRLPIHPEHLAGLDADLRSRITLETGYGERFGYADHDLADLVGTILPREDLVVASDVVLLPKPQLMLKPKPQPMLKPKPQPMPNRLQPLLLLRQQLKLLHLRPLKQRQ